MINDEIKNKIVEGRAKHGSMARYGREVGINPSRLYFFLKGEVESLYPSEVRKIMGRDYDRT